MEHKVIYPFFDLQDKNRHVYRVGDSFPYEGEVSEERIAELSGDNNALKRPVIETVKVEEKEVKPKTKRTRKKPVTESEG